MTTHLTSVLNRLVTEARAEAALVWCRVAPAGGALLLGAYPDGVPAGPMPGQIPDDSGSGFDRGDKDRLATPLPEPLLKQLPAPPSAARSFPLGEGLSLTLVWCDPAVSASLTQPGQQQALKEVAAAAEVVREMQFTQGDVERLRAVVNNLQDGVVTVSEELGLAAVNRAAAHLLNLPRGKNPLSLFDSALAGLAKQAVNPAEVDACMALLDADPTASLECMWRFPGEPSHLWVVSKPVRDQGFQGRNWVFYDESESAQALESLARAHAQLRASADGMLEPQAFLEAVRDPGGAIVDFIYRDVNRAACTYLSMNREDLVGRSPLATLPNLKSSGLLALFAQCVTSREPLILDDVSYDNEILSGRRRYDLRGNSAGGDFMTLTWRDVTERFESARRITQSEQRFRLLAENSGDVVMHVRDGVIVWISPSVRQALGAPPEHWVGRNLVDIIPHEDHDAHGKVTWLTADRAVIPRGRVAAADGTTHWVYVHAKAFHDTDGTADGYTASFRVIDDEVEALAAAEDARRKQAEADARYRKLIDSSAVPLAVTTPDGRFEVVNEAMCRYFGYDADVLRTKRWPDLAAPEYRDADLAEFAEITAGTAATHRGVKEYLHADGRRIWGDLAVSFLRKQNGAVESIITQIIDITDQVRTAAGAKEARRQESATRARYRNLMDNAAVGMGVIEPDGRLEEVNQAACTFFGYDAATLTQMTWQQLTPPEYLEADFVNVENMMSGRIDSFRLTKQFIHADGHLVWGDLSVGCLRRPNGDLDRMIAQVSDITLEVEARTYLARREEQNRILTERLQAKTDRLAAELRSAAAYVESILPSNLDGPVCVSSRYLPSRELGGDCFDYRWVDDDHLIAYVIDVSGHGIEASLMSISVHNLLRSTSLLEANLLDPAAVLAELNKFFTMERHSDNYLTIWYGVYERSSRTLSYASGGHPPALLASSAGHGRTDVTQLATTGFPVGMFNDGEFISATTIVAPGSQLLLYSDGAYELPTPDDSTWSLDDLVGLFAQLAQSPDWSLDTLLDQLKAHAKNRYLDDDCSLVRMTFS
jgi:PAS domain S-box-containing protein